ncbi:hypothetical protein EVA_16819 [gut metagenome]|uniref:Uncharacterized protein n=1 Tax=gut metagenome TaxID=749906 RepID=J9FJL3_9ZZZZ
MVVVQTTEYAQIQPIVAIACTQMLTQAEVLVGILLHLCLVEDFSIIAGTCPTDMLLCGFLVAIEGTHISHGVSVAEVGERRNGIVLILAQSCIEHEHGAGIPVTVDILRSHVAHTSSFVIHHQVADRIVGLVEEDTSTDTLLQLRIIAVVESLETVGPARFQSWVTHGNAQRVGVVHHVQEVGHRRLGSRTIVADVQVLGLGETIAEAHLRRDIEDIAGNQRIDMLSWTFVCHLRLLRIQIHTHIETNGFALVADTQVGGVIHILIGSILAIEQVTRSIEQFVLGRQSTNQRMVQRIVPGVLRVVEDFIEVVAGTIVIRIAEVIAITQFGKPILEEGFHVTCTHAVVPVFGRRFAVLVQVFRSITIVIGDIGNGKAIVFAFAISSRQTQRNVASFRIQSTHDIQITIDIIALAVTQRLAAVAVHRNGFEFVIRIILEDAVQRVVHAIDCIRILIEGRCQAIAVILAAAMAVRWTETNARHRVRVPFQT